ncbi:MAG: protein kinase [Desulfobulbaceae bacterium]|nr:MAG: protein kinase [Desulfobulbaceae bacterium]
MKYRRFSATHLILLFVLLSAATTLFQAPSLVATERYLLTLRAGLIPTPEQSPVVAVQLTESENSRATLAELVRRLSRQKAGAILLCLPLSSSVSGELAQRLRIMREKWGRSPEAADSALWRRVGKELSALERELDVDVRLGAALHEAGNAVLAAPVRTFGEVDGTSAQLHRLTLRFDLPDWSWLQHLRHFSNPLPSLNPGVHITAAQVPPEELRDQAAGVGFLAAAEEETLVGILLLPVGQGYLPSAALTAAMVSRKASLESLGLASPSPGTAVLSIGGHRYPLDSRLRLLPMPASLSADMAQVSASDILAGTSDPALVTGKVAVVAHFAQPGAREYTEARLVSQLLGDFQLSRPGWLPVTEVLVLLYFAFFLWLAVPRLPGRTALILMGSFVLVWLVVATALLVNFGWWFQLTPPVLLTGFGLLLLDFSRRMRERSVKLNELSCSLGRMLQEKGLLDQALERYQACPPQDATVRELIYQLGLDFERKRQFGQALRAYDYLAEGGRYKDIAARIARLGQNGASVPLGRQGNDVTVVLEKGAVHPTLGRYEIVSELGQGAMGTVYRGRDPKINREVAIKTLAYCEVDETQLPMVKERFFREAEAAGRLNHPGIVTIFDAGEEHDLAYLAMEFLGGEDLSAYCKPDTLLPVAEVLELVADIAEALAYAHANDVVHRDIKPANIMRLPDGSVKVTDFGIAQVVSASKTQTGVVLGTPSYMSPEQVAAKKVDGRSDLFSLGSVCYEMLCGEKAFVGDSIASLMFNISNVRYTPLSERRKGLPICVHDLVDMLLARSPARRPENAAIVAEAARACREKVRK